MIAALLAATAYALVLFPDYGVVSGGSPVVFPFYYEEKAACEAAGAEVDERRGDYLNFRCVLIEDRNQRVYP